MQLNNQAKERRGGILDVYYKAKGANFTGPYTTDCNSMTFIEYAKLWIK